MVSTAAAYFAIGLGLGLLTSVPIGVANVAVVDAGLRSGRRRALATGAGAALADTIHATAAFAGLGPLVEAYPRLTAAMYLASGVLIAGYGALALRAASRPQAAGAARAGFAVGLMLTLFNPAALVAWIVVAGALAPASVGVGVVAAVGVGVGAFACFAALGHLASRGRDVLRDSGRGLARWVGAALIALGVLSLARGVHLWLTR